MSWTNDQKKTAVMACRAAKISDEHRYLILQQFGHAMFNGRVSSTSPRLTNADFEQFMATVEHVANGQILHYSRGYWQGKAADPLQRMHFMARQIADQLIAAEQLAGEAGFLGFMDRQSGGIRDLNQLDYHKLYSLIEGLKGFARNRHLSLSA